MQVTSSCRTVPNSFPVPVNGIQYFQCIEQLAIWNGRLEEEEEGTEGCFRSVHAKGNCASIQFTDNTVKRISASCVTVIYIWDPSFSVASVGSMSCIGNLVSTFVKPSAV